MIIPYILIAAGTELIKAARIVPSRKAQHSTSETYENTKNNILKEKQILQNT